MAPTLWLLGYPDQALEKLNEAWVRVSQLDHPFSEAYARFHAAMLYQVCGEEQAAQKQAEALLTLSNKQGFIQRQAHAALLCGWTSFIQGQGDTGIHQMCEVLESLGTNKIELLRSYGLYLLAEAYRETGRIDEGLHTLSEAIQSIQNTKEHRWEAEIYRLKGELLLKHSAENQKEAEQCFHQALHISRKQQAKSLELRSAISLSQLLQQQGQHASAHRQLAEVYSWFTEGFNTPDLQKAKALLNQSISH